VLAPAPREPGIDLANADSADVDQVADLSDLPPRGRPVWEDDRLVGAAKAHRPHRGFNGRGRFDDRTHQLHDKAGLGERRGNHRNGGSGEEK